MPPPYFLFKGHHSIPFEPTLAPSSPTSQPSCHLPRGPGVHGLHAELRPRRPAPAGISAPRWSPESAGLGQGGAAAYLDPRGHPGEALDCHWPPSVFLLPCPFGILGLWQLRQRAPGLTPRGCDSGSPELAGDSSRNWPHQEDPCEFDVSRVYTAEFHASQGCVGRLCLKQQNNKKTGPISQPRILTSQHLKRNNNKRTW